MGKPIRSLSVAVVVFVVAAPSSVFAATALELGSSGQFAVLAGAAVTNSGASAVTGDVGLSPFAGTFYTGFKTATVTGNIYSVNNSGPVGFRENPELLAQSKFALDGAFDAAAAQGPVTPIYSNLGGNILTPGVYGSVASISLAGRVTLDGGGDANAVFIFQTDTTLVTGANSEVVLTGGATACNIYWRVGKSATLGTGSHFIGTILADQSITDSGSSIVLGRLLTRKGKVTLRNTKVAVPTCTGEVSTPTPSAEVNASSSSGPAEPTPTPTPTQTPIESPALTLTPTPTVTGDVASPSATPLAEPMIHVVSEPSSLSLPFGGGTVTYTALVSNPGTVALSNVTLDDSVCSPMAIVSGDTNADGMLDSSETWTYSCETGVTETTSNTALAGGQFNGITATDSATATVTVGGVPELPSTGFPPDEHSRDWYFIMIFVILPLFLITVYTIRSVLLRKRSIASQNGSLTYQQK